MSSGTSGKMIHLEIALLLRHIFFLNRLQFPMDVSPPPANLVFDRADWTFSARPLKIAASDFAEKLCGKVWKSVEKCGIMWNYVELCGIVWSCVECGIVWNSHVRPSTNISDVNSETLSTHTHIQQCSVVGIRKQNNIGGVFCKFRQRCGKVWKSVEIKDCKRL